MTKSMTAFKVGDVVSVQLPFSDLQTHKRRPGLVLVSGEIDLLVARITTHPPREPSDVLLKSRSICASHSALSRFAM
ncbi:MAG: hypothetical protein O2960_12825 [Verrucomicrobia bacterium]|nr:hypothetical protein [Verrucomicrobiota bacterium]